MSISITHAKVNPDADNPGATIKPSDWNAGHTVTGVESSLGNPDVDGKVLSSTAAGVRSWITPSAGGSGGFIPLLSSTFNPNDGGYYYFGCMPLIATYGDSRKIYVNHNCTMNEIEILIDITGAGSNETVNFYYKIDTLPAVNFGSMNFNNSATGEPVRLYATGLGVSLTAGQRLNFYFIGPTWTTNPTGVTLGGYIYLT